MWGFEDCRGNVDLNPSVRMLLYDAESTALSFVGGVNVCVCVCLSICVS